VHVYQVTKYDPAHFGERGYFGTEDLRSDHGRLEAAYLDAVEAFAQDTGVTEVTIREPEVAGIVKFGLEPTIPGHGLAGLFPSDLTGYHDGAHVPLATGIALVRAMVRDNGAWCRLEVDGRFSVHVGNASRWHRLGDVAVIRSGLTPRARLVVWPELADDVTTELRTLEDHGLATVVWEHGDSKITDLDATDEDYLLLRVELAQARAAMVIPGYADDYHPLLTATLPDDDGVVRTRWSK
jgi:small subunit ribosomal protein S1